MRRCYVQIWSRRFVPSSSSSASISSCSSSLLCTSSTSASLRYSSRFFSTEAGSNSRVIPASRLNDSLTLEDFLGLEAQSVRSSPPSSSSSSSSPTPSSSSCSSSSTATSTSAPRRKPFVPKPSWLKAPLPEGADYHRLKSTVKSLGLATVCEEAKCPNIGECWSSSSTSSSATADGSSIQHHNTATATIMLMGDTCTRGCRFCAIKTSRTPPPLDADEPAKVSEAISRWGLGYVVLTSVDRDDLADGGAAHIAATIRHLTVKSPSLFIECLTPDFAGNFDCIDLVANSGLHVYAHNIETVENLQKFVRDYRANYRQSLRVLERVKTVKSSLITKTSIMLGCGEEEEEIEQTLRDLRLHGVDVVTFGQYLRPTPKHMKVANFVTPEKFVDWGERAKQLGFLYVASGPLVRSSYKAGELYLKNVLNARKHDHAASSSATVSTSASPFPAASDSVAASSPSSKLSASTPSPIATLENDIASRTQRSSL